MQSKSSFRDPSGFIFIQKDGIYRQINNNYKMHYDHLMNSGLYSTLIEQGLLIPHEEVNSSIATQHNDLYKVIKPQVIPFISYPYEWSFNQLKDAALLTLGIQKIALEYGMTLKDSSAYNVQFYNGKPVFIDTLSFELYNEGNPWVGYRQFCQHFFAPLALMSKSDIRLNQLLRVYLDGIPVDLASNLLSFKTYFNWSILAHIHLHAKSQKRYGNKNINTEKINNRMKKEYLIALIDSLESSIKKLHWEPKNTEWADYYNDTNYTENGVQHKKQIVEQFLAKVNPKTVWDIGGNVGIFSRLASDKGIPTICFDIDPAAVDKNYLEVKKRNEKNLLPLLLDVTNPSPNIGWENEERESLLSRCRSPVDMVFALALIHHLVISNNIPFDKISSFFGKISKYLLIEFVPKEDSQVQRLLSTRKDVFPQYTRDHFERVFSTNFEIVESQKIADSQRVLYLMLNHNFALS